MRTISVDELAPCPFCGGAADVWQTDERSSGHEVFCADAFDKCSVQPKAWGMTKPEAIAAWNRRTPPSGEAEERADHLRMLAFRDIFAFRPDSTTGKDAYEQIAIHARSTVIETQRAIALLPTIKEPTDGK